MNKGIIIGRAVRDPELKTSTSGVVYSTISIASNVSKDETLFLDISTFKESITLSEKVSLQGLFPIKRPIVKLMSTTILIQSFFLFFILINCITNCIKEFKYIHIIYFTSTASLCFTYSIYIRDSSKWICFRFIIVLNIFILIVLSFVFFSVFLRFDIKDAWVLFVY